MLCGIFAVVLPGALAPAGLAWDKGLLSFDFALSQLAAIAHTTTRFAWTHSSLATPPGSLETLLGCRARPTRWRCAACLGSLGSQRSSCTGAASHEPQCLLQCSRCWPAATSPSCGCPEHPVSMRPAKCKTECLDELLPTAAGLQTTTHCLKAVSCRDPKLRCTARRGNPCCLAALPKTQSAWASGAGWRFAVQLISWSVRCRDSAAWCPYCERVWLQVCSCPARRAVRCVLLGQWLCVLLL